MKDFAGFGILGYRSFSDAEELQFVGPMANIHLVVGRNNVGKSNLLEFMHTALGAQPSERVFPARTRDSPVGWSSDQSRGFAIGLYRTPEVLAALNLGQNGTRWLKLLSTPAFTRGDPSTIWLEFEGVRPGDDLRQAQASFLQIKKAFEQLGTAWGLSLSNLSMEVAHSGSGDDSKNWANVVRVWNIMQFVPSTLFVSALRDLTREDGPDTGRETGAGLVPKLLSLQAPEDKNYDENTAKFKALNEFVSSVLEDTAARIEVPSSGSTVFVHTQNQRFPVEALGTGISEVIILAALATGSRGVLICIEEPEVHLHPTLQRKLISYLNASTQNRYLISTHSASLLNAGVASISHVTKTGAISEVASISSPMDMAGAAFDLGNRASDVVQSNFIVWVEGPSDRIYILLWISLTDPGLIEGAHFTVMFYGGGLLNHLSADDAEAEELISLLRINRHLAIVIDSDMKSADDLLNSTKLRVIAEAEESGGYTWVTDGYTIENLVPTRHLSKAIESAYPDKTLKLTGAKFASPLAKSFAGLKMKPSKVVIARSVAALNIRLRDWPVSVLINTTELVRRIRAANGLD